MNRCGSSVFATTFFAAACSHRPFPATRGRGATERLRCEPQFRCGSLAQPAAGGSSPAASAASLMDASTACRVHVFTAYLWDLATHPANTTQLAGWVTEKLRRRAVALWHANRSGAACFTAILDEPVARLVNASTVAPWRVPTAPPAELAKLCGRVNHRGSCTPRFRSKIFKMQPHLLFPEAEMVVFVDFKLVLRVGPVALAETSLRRQDAVLALFQHPCVSTMALRTNNTFDGFCNASAEGHSARSWIQQEARLVSAVGRVESAAKLQAQVTRYVPSIAEDSHAYPDTALLFWRAAHPQARVLGEAWLTEFGRADSSDRDQPPLAMLLNAPQAPWHSAVNLLPPTLPACGESCIWYYSEDVRSVAFVEHIYFGGHLRRAPKPRTLKARRHAAAVRPVDDAHCSSPDACEYQYQVEPPL
eukprot:499051-Prymnesium_polylepis.1